MTHLYAFLATFSTVFLKGFQHKNVISGRLKAIVITSYLMAAGDVIFVSIIIKGGLVLALSCGTGAALGMLISVKYYDTISKLLTHSHV